MEHESRWWVEVWTTPPGPERYRDAHERHRQFLLEEGRGETVYCGTVENVGKVSALCREYKTKRGAEKRAAELSGQWGDRFFIDIVSGFILTGWSW